MDYWAILINFILGFIIIWILLNKKNHNKEELQRKRDEEWVQIKLERIQQEFVIMLKNKIEEKKFEENMQYFTKLAQYTEDRDEELKHSCDEYTSKAANKNLGLQNDEHSEYKHTVANDDH